VLPSIDDEQPAFVKAEFNMAVLDSEDFYFHNELTEC